MVCWSSLLRPTAKQLLSTTKILNNNNALNGGKRYMSGDHGPNVMAIRPSRYQWNKFKDMVHFYLMAGLIPVTAIIFCCNVFIGPAQLQPIPEDYVPKHWEYHKHPISRFLARYLYCSPQQDYEKHLHYVFEENEKMQIKILEEQIRDKMAERNDYQAYYYRPVIAKYHRISKEAADKLDDRYGDF